MDLADLKIVDAGLPRAAGTLSAVMLERMHAYRRAANYLSVGR